jgi:predicted transcriptional regulator
MAQATFELPEDLLAALESLAAERRSTPFAMMQLALAELLRKRRLSGEEWIEGWQNLQREVSKETPPGVTPEQIESEIDASTGEVWAERRDSRRN